MTETSQLQIYTHPLDSVPNHENSFVIDPTNKSSFPNEGSVKNSESDRMGLLPEIRNEETANNPLNLSWESVMIDSNGGQPNNAPAEQNDQSICL